MVESPEKSLSPEKRDLHSSLQDGEDKKEQFENCENDCYAGEVLESD